MTQQDYEKARQQCWNAAALNNCLDDVEENKERLFDFVFDNAFALGMKAANKQQWINVDRQLPETDNILEKQRKQQISDLELSLKKLKREYEVLFHKYCLLKNDIDV